MIDVRIKFCKTVRSSAELFENFVSERIRTLCKQ